MAPISIEPWHDVAHEIQPQAALETWNGSRPYVEALHVEGGIVEIVDPQNLSPEEMIVASLGALGLTNPQISQMLSYSTKTVWDQQLRIFHKIGSINRVNNVPKLLGKRYMRIVSPIEPPALGEKEQEIFWEIALGKSTKEAADSLGYTPSSVKNYAASILRKFDADRMSRAVLLGHMGLVMPSYLSRLEKVTENSPDRYTLGVFRPESARVDSDFTTDFVEWEGGVFSFRPDSSFQYSEQLLLAFAAMGKSRAEINNIMGVSERIIDQMFSGLYETLGATNRPHALSLALAQEEIRVTREIEPLGLTKIEHDALVTAATDMDDEQAMQYMGRSLSQIRKINSETYKKLGVRKITPAIMKAYLSQEVSVEEIKDIFAAMPPASRR